MTDDAIKVIEQCLREIYRETQHSPNLEAWGIVAKLKEAGLKIIAREPTEAMLEAYEYEPTGKGSFRAMWDAAP